MLAGAKDGDVVTKQSCCAVLSTLSSKVMITHSYSAIGCRSRGDLQVEDESFTPRALSAYGA